MENTKYENCPIKDICEQGYTCERDYRFCVEYKTNSKILRKRKQNSPFTGKSRLYSQIDVIVSEMFGESNV